jgi:hypothetical protein
MRKDLSEEDLAVMQSIYDSTVEKVKQALADAISWQPLWDQLMAPELRPALAANLDEVSFDRLVTLALGAGLIETAVNEWAYGKPLPEML